MIRRLSIIWALSVSLLATTASAQQAAIGEASVQRFTPAFGPRNYLGVAGARTRGRFAWSSALVFDYARDPFVLRDCTAADCSTIGDEVHVVQDLFTWNVMGTFNPLPRLQLGLRLPVVYASGEGLDPASGRAQADGLSAVGVGDPALEGKYRIYGEADEPIVIGALAGLSAPLGRATAGGSYVGDSPLSGRAGAIVDGHFGPVMVAANLTGLFRGESNMGASSMGSELGYGVVGGVTPLRELVVFTEILGATRFSDKTGSNALELLGGVRYALSDLGLEITAGGGGGLMAGVGAPLARGVLEVSYSMTATTVEDSDGDGVSDELDKCPGEKEDKDGIADEDGCPETDADHDKILDQDDLCPESPEKVNGYEDQDGCPDEIADRDGDGVPDARDACPDKRGSGSKKGSVGCPDSDGDGVSDQRDECPTDKEDEDGFEDEDGCPDLDHDHDGVPDTADQCLGAPEIFNGIDDEDGCPDQQPDADGDGIADKEDRCPRRAENLNGVRDGDGCPESYLPTLAWVGLKEVRLAKPLRFDAQGLDEASRQALDALASGLVSQRGILLLQVVVTSTPAGAAQAAGRSRAVIDRLVGKGVTKSRLQSKTEIGTTEGVRFEVLWSLEKKKQ